MRRTPYSEEGEANVRVLRVLELPQGEAEETTRRATSVAQAGIESREGFCELCGREKRKKAKRREAIQTDNVHVLGHARDPTDVARKEDVGINLGSVFSHVERLAQLRNEKKECRGNEGTKERGGIEHSPSRWAPGRRSRRYGRERLAPSSS